MTPVPHAGRPPSCSPLPPHGIPGRELPECTRLRTSGFRGQSEGSVPPESRQASLVSRVGELSGRGHMIGLSLPADVRRVVPGLTQLGRPAGVCPVGRHVGTTVDMAVDNFVDRDGVGLACGRADLRHRSWSCVDSLVRNLASLGCFT